MKRAYFCHEFSRPRMISMNFSILQRNKMGESSFVDDDWSNRKSHMTFKEDNRGGFQCNSYQNENPHFVEFNILHFVTENNR